MEVVILNCLGKQIKVSVLIRLDCTAILSLKSSNMKVHCCWLHCSLCGGRSEKIVDCG